MATTQTQNYANHAHRPTLWLVSALTAVSGFAIAILFVWRAPGIISLGVLLSALSLVCTVLVVRGNALRLQDRIIRLEMQTRLARLGLSANVDRLTLKHLVALRFASDLELPALIDRTLKESLNGDQIKRAVKDWQGDFMRT